MDVEFLLGGMKMCWNESGNGCTTLNILKADELYTLKE